MGEERERERERLREGGGGERGGNPRVNVVFFTAYEHHTNTHTHRRLLGIITKKDVLRHIAQREHKDPNTIRFH